MIDSRRLEKEKPKFPELPPNTTYRCNFCKRHLVEFNGAFWVCARLIEEETSHAPGCGRQFVKDVYPQKEGGDTE